MKLQKSICVVLTMVFTLIFAGMAYAEEYVHKVEYIKHGEKEVSTFGAEIKPMLPDLYVQTGAHMSIFLGEMEILTLDDVPWQLSEYADEMREGFKREPDSIVNLHPELEDLIFDVRSNGKYGTIYKLAKQGKSADYIKSVVLGEDADTQPETPAAAETPAEPQQSSEPVQTVKNNEVLDANAVFTLYVNSNKYSIRNGDLYEGGTLSAAPFIYNQTTMVPLRGVIDRFGADLAWDADNRTVTVIKGEDTVVLTIDVDKAQVNGKTQDLDTPPIINRNRTFIPLRFVSEGLGFEVTWNADEKSVTIKQ